MSYNYWGKERAEMLGCINKLRFFKEYARWGDRGELAQFWVDSGQAEEFSKTHGHIHIKDPAKGSEWEE